MTLQPLAGLSVIEIGSAASVAFAARVLAELGANVLKIEPPAGDPLRQHGPFYDLGGDRQESALFTHLNAGKTCLTLDLSKESDCQALQKRAKTANLLLISDCTAIELLGRPAEADTQDRPVVLVATPFGLTGPRSGWAGSEYIAQHSGGYAYHQACPVADPKITPPVGCADREAELLAGLVVANAALWGVMAGDRGDAKPFIDLSLEDVFAYMLVDPLADLHRGAQPPGRERAPGQGVTIAGGLVWFLPCSDGAILVSPREDHQWHRWVELMGSPEWSRDPTLCASREVRTRNARALQEKMAVWSVNEKAREVFLRAQAARVACFPVSTAEDLIANPQLAARRFFNTLAGAGKSALPGLPFAMRSSSGDELVRGSTLDVPERVSVDSLPDTPAGPERAAPSGVAAADPRLPFTGVRVIDFSWVMAGPMTTKMLGAMGAEIIKIESTIRPEFSYREAWFAVINNNKKSCTLDITKPEAQDMIRELAKNADVVVENFSSRVLRKNGLAYEDLAKVNPRIIFVSASGVGRTGPECDLLAYGSLLQAYSGRVSMIGRMNPALEAMGVMPAWTDPVTSLWESLAVLTALRHRDRTGEGSYVDLSMLEATVSLLPDAILRAGLGQDRAENGSETELGAAPSGCFRCSGADDWLAISVRTDAEWAALASVVGYSADEEYRDAGHRLAGKSKLNDFVADWCRLQNATEAERLLQSRGVPAARTRGIHDLVADAHTRQRGCYRQLADGSWTTVLPWRDLEGWRGIFSPTPPLGGSNEYVLGKLLGLSRGRQNELKQAGVVR